MEGEIERERERGGKKCRLKGKDEMRCYEKLNEKHGGGTFVSFDIDYAIDYVLE